MSSAFCAGTAQICCDPLWAFLSALVSSLLVASKYSLVPGAAQVLSEGTTLGCWFVKLKFFPAAAMVFVEEVFQVKIFVKLQEWTGFVQVMVLAVRERSRGAMSPGLSPPGCCGSLHHPGEWKATNPIPLSKHMQLWKAFLSCWCRTGGASTIFLSSFPDWKEVFLSVFSGFLFFWAVSTRLVWSETNKNPQEPLPRRVQWLPTRILKNFLPGGYSGSQYATLSSTVMQRAGAAHCGMLGGSPTIFAEQISAEMGHLLLEEGAGTSGKISWRQKWWRDVKELSDHSGRKGMYGLLSC